MSPVPTVIAVLYSIGICFKSNCIIYLSIQNSLWTKTLK